MRNPEWNVYVYNINSKRIERYNIFHHWSFRENVEKIMKKFKKEGTKEECARKLRSELMYYFWSKSEWEIIVAKEDDRVIIQPWIGNDDVYLDVTECKDFDWAGLFHEIAEKKYKVHDCIKVDVWDQVNYQFEAFVDYCWDKRFEYRER